jgi:hypothetical protein
MMRFSVIKDFQKGTEKKSAQIKNAAKVDVKLTSLFVAAVKVLTIHHVLIPHW